MMQSSQKVEEIVQYKTHLIGNKKVIEDMQIALNDMQQDDKINKHYAFFGLTVLIPIIIYISFLFLI